MRINDKELKQLSLKPATVEGTLQYMKPQGNDWSDLYRQTTGQIVYKERVFKLVHNCLFYYRTTDQEDPLGVFILEQMQVAYESPTLASFAFSLTSNDGKHIFACRCQEDVNKWVAALKVASYTYWRAQHEVLQCKLAKLKGVTWSSHYSQHYQQQGPQETTQMKTQNLCSTFYQKMPVGPGVPGDLGLSESKVNPFGNADLAVITKKMSKSTFYSQTHSDMTMKMSTEEKTSTNSNSSSGTRYQTRTFDHFSSSKQEHQQLKVQQSNVPVDNLIDL